MSTRSRIGMVIGLGRIRSVYCHSDGYLDGVGATLREHYTSATKIKALIALGDLSCLYELVAPPPSVEHSFDFGKRATGVTVAYKRDRGEKDTDPQNTADEKAFLELADECNAEYAYLWKAGKWHVWCLHEGSSIQGGELVAEMVAEAIAP